MDTSEHMYVMERLSDLDKDIKDIKFDIDRILDKLSDMHQLIMGSLETCAKGYNNCKDAYKDCEMAFDAIPDRVTQGVYHT